MIQRLKLKYGDDVEETTLLSKMMAYCSKEAHSSVEKAAMISFVKLRILEPDENCSLRGDTLRQAMEEDMANGMYPFFVSTTLGTTGCCAFDNIQEIGEASESCQISLASLRKLFYCTRRALVREVRSLASRGRCLRRECLHLSRISVSHERRRGW